MMGVCVPRTASNIRLSPRKEGIFRRITHQQCDLRTNISTSKARTKTVSVIYCSDVVGCVDNETKMWYNICAMRETRKGCVNQPVCCLILCSCPDAAYAGGGCGGPRTRCIRHHTAFRWKLRPIAGFVRASVRRICTSPVPTGTGEVVCYIALSAHCTHQMIMGVP